VGNNKAIGLNGKWEMTSERHSKESSSVELRDESKARAVWEQSARLAERSQEDTNYRRAPRLAD